MYILYLLIVLALVILLDYLIAKKFADVAEMKGHDRHSYFWLTFLLGLVGMLLVIALPDLKCRPNYVEAPQVYAPQPQYQPVAQPQYQPVAQPQPEASMEANRNNQPMKAEILNGEKICPSCGQAQRANRNVCWSCGQRFGN